VPCPSACTRESATRTFAELLIDCDQDRTLRAVLIGILRERPLSEPLVYRFRIMSWLQLVRSSIRLPSMVKKIRSPADVYLSGPAAVRDARDRQGA
jgi:hypothetical protein